MDKLRSVCPVTRLECDHKCVRWDVRSGCNLWKLREKAVKFMDLAVLLEDVVKITQY